MHVIKQSTCSIDVIIIILYCIIVLYCSEDTKNFKCGIIWIWRVIARN